MQRLFAPDVNHLFDKEKITATFRVPLARLSGIN